MAIERYEYAKTCIGYRQITDLSEVVGCPLNFGKFLHAQAQGQLLRYRLDGEDPTETTVTPLYPGETLRYTGDLRKVKFFAPVPSGAVLNVEVFV